MKIHTLFSSPLRNLTYLIFNEKTREAIVIDPTEAKKVLEIIEKHGLKLKFIINTHSHFDHIAGNEELKKKTGAKIVAHENSLINSDLKVKDNDVLKIGNLKIKVIHTPGHTNDSICLLIDKKLFTGDTIFVKSYGRTDLPTGNFNELINSVEKLKKLDDDIKIYPGHDYGDKKVSTIKEEKIYNPIFRYGTKE
ncbi:MAG: hydroxyacylglutathione hydrolase family protein [Candidatus Aenigmatarchaeota archaeon]